MLVLLRHALCPAVKSLHVPSHSLAHFTHCSPSVIVQYMLDWNFVNLNLLACGLSLRRGKLSLLKRNVEPYRLSSLDVPHLNNQHLQLIPLRHLPGRAVDWPYPRPQNHSCSAAEDDLCPWQLPP